MLVLCWLSLVVNERGFLRQLKEGGSLRERPSCENLPGDGPWEQGRACRQFVPAFSSLPSFLQARLLFPLPRPHRVTAGQRYRPASLWPNWGHGHPGHQSAHAALGVVDLSLSCVALFFVFSKLLILEHLNLQKSCIHPFTFKVPSRGMCSISIAFSIFILKHVCHHHNLNTLLILFPEPVSISHVTMIHAFWRLQTISLSTHLVTLISPCPAWLSWGCRDVFECLWCRHVRVSLG